jgi:hypothetical protein
MSASEVEGSGTWVALAGGLGWGFLGLAGPNARGSESAEVLVAIPASLLGIGIGLTGIGKSMDAKTTRKKVEASGRILVGASLAALPFTISKWHSLIDDHPIRLRVELGIELIIFASGITMIGLAEDIGKIMKW